YDYLILASGAAANFFGLKGVEQFGLTLKDIPDAVRIRNQVLSCFEEAMFEPDAERRRALLTFVVVGGGPTGVEMAGALSELIRHVLKKDYPNLDLNEVRVILLEAADSVLGTFRPSLRAAAQRSLEKKGVEVRLGAKVAEVTDTSIRLAGGEEINAGTVVWTAGVRASDVGALLGLERGRQMRLPVLPTLQVPGHPVVFVIGDLAGAVVDGMPLPMLIPVAMQEGRRVAATISDMARNGGASAFVYKDPGTMATIGRNSAVAQLGRVHLSGFLGWVFWLTVHLVNVVSFRSRVLVLINWAWDYLFYDRPIRLILRASRDRPEDPGASQTGRMRG
ncbi:MAG TPA: FAD-dependent oxidoreductase, partial [Methylomirabilota bacterium]|nr:FAD-dependent oxidoreductase [Methylomirabilota bacterium]